MERLVGDHRKASSLRLLKLKFYLGLAPLVFGAFWRVLVFPTFFPDRRKATGSQIIISNKPQAQSHLDFVGVLHLEHTLEHKGQTRQNRRVATMRSFLSWKLLNALCEARTRGGRGAARRPAASSLWAVITDCRRLCAAVKTPIQSGILGWRIHLKNVLVLVR